MHGDVIENAVEIDEVGDEEVAEVEGEAGEDDLVVIQGETWNA